MDILRRVQKSGRREMLYKTAIEDPEVHTTRNYAMIDNGPLGAIIGVPTWPKRLNFTRKSESLWVSF